MAKGGGGGGGGWTWESKCRRHTYRGDLQQEDEVAHGQTLQHLLCVRQSTARLLCGEPLRQRDPPLPKWSRTGCVQVRLNRDRLAARSTSVVEGLRYAHKHTTRGAKQQL